MPEGPQKPETPFLISSPLLSRDEVAVVEQVGERHCQVSETWKVLNERRQLAQPVVKPRNALGAEELVGEAAGEARGAAEEGDGEFEVQGGEEVEGGVGDGGVEGDGLEEEEEEGVGEEESVGGVEDGEAGVVAGWRGLALCHRGWRV